MIDAPLFIDGEMRDASNGLRFEVINPMDESVAGTAADATERDIDNAVTAARRAFDQTTWSTDHAFRHSCLLQLQQGLRSQMQEFKRIQTLEAGICMNISGLMDVAVEEMSFAIDLIESTAWEVDFPVHEMLGMRSLRRVRHEPYGVVAAITPWNAPFLLNLWKTIPALATGNTVVLKTAPETPLVGALLAAVIRDNTDIPPGVINIVTASDNAVGGDTLTGDARVDMFHFTGSTGVGERIASRAAKGLRKVVLELGGKSANIILDDADLDVAVPHGVGMCMLNSGQGCTLATRMLIHESLYDEAVSRLAEAVNQVPVGDPREMSTVVGPIIRENQVIRIKDLVDRAVEEGARVVAGGQRLDRNGKGFWYAPTVVADVGEDFEIAQTEVFGPVLSVLRYSGSDTDAVRMANNSLFGLSGYVQSRDVERARVVANRLRTGTVSINQSIHNSPDTPFGGYKSSGLGREHGVEGWMEFLQSKTVASPAP